MDSVNEGLKHVAKAKELIDAFIRERFVLDDILQVRDELEKAVEALTKCST